MNNNASAIAPNKNIAATCGIYCGACSIYIATQENNVAMLQYFATAFNQTVEETVCDGCRSERKSKYCKVYCTFNDCAKEKKVEFCGECNEYPCERLKDFQGQMPHRAELWNSQETIVKEGWEKWLAEIDEFNRCPECATLNSAYNLACRKCNHVPGSKFVEKHFSKIQAHLANRTKQS